MWRVDGKAHGRLWIKTTFGRTPFREGIDVTTKESLHRLIDELPEDALAGVEHYLAAVRDDPMMRVLLATPLDDEATTPEDDDEARDARARYRRGEYLTADEAKSRLLE